MFKQILFLTAAAFITQAATSQNSKDFRSAQTDTFYSKVVADPYRALEDTANPKVKAWMKSEATQTEAFFASMPGYQKLVDDFTKQLLNTKEDWIQSVKYHKGAFYVVKQMAGNDNPNLYKIDKAGKATLLVNPSKDFPEIESKNLSISEIIFNPNGSEMLYGLTVGGYEFDPKIVMRNLSTDKQKYDTLYQGKGDFILAFDPEHPSAFYYQHLPRFNNKAIDPTRWFDSATIRYHVVGSHPSTDKEIIGLDPAIIKRNIDEDAWVVIEKGLPYALAYVKNKVADEYRIYSAPATTLKSGNIPWKQLTDWDDKVSAYAVKDHWLYLLTSKGASNYKVLRLDLRNGSLATAVEVMPPSKRLLESIAVTKNEVLITALYGGVGKLYRIPHGTSKLDSLKLPVPGNINLTWADRNEPDFIATITSYVRPATLYHYNAAAKKFTPSFIQSYHNTSIAPLTVKDVLVKSHDGVMVPMTLVYKKGLKLDGSHPVSLRAYGSYGAQDNPSYWPEDMDWFNRGGIRAYAHVRGGGVYGKEWHLAGQKANKHNTWKDVIACAEWLIANKYATPKTLVGTGTSAGGITMGRTVTERPDLFGGMFLNVGALDMIRFETSPNGEGNVPEFGTVKTEEGFNALYEMSAYHHVKDGTAYPPILITHGVNDNRVPVNNSLKMAARLKEANSSANPVMLRLEFDEGHGMQMSMTQMAKRAAGNMAFYYWRAGFPAFQPAAKGKGF